MGELRFHLRVCAVVLLIGGVVSGLVACKSRAPKVSMTAGHAVIGASDAVHDLAWKLSGAFQAGNRAAFVDIVRATNRSLVDSLLNERCEEIFLDRKLMPAETLAFRAAKLKLYTYPVAFHPVFLLVHRENPVASLDSALLRSILEGRVRNWLDAGGDNVPLTLYMPLPGEGAFESVVAYFGRPDSIVAEACSTAAQMLERAKDDPGALLVYSLPCETLPFKPLRFAREGVILPANVQTILDEPAYPFRLDITYITTRNKGDVAAGYLTFAVSNTGQREVMRLGYRPAAVPVRIVKMRKG